MCDIIILVLIKEVIAMSNEKQQLINVIEKLPDELTGQALQLIKQLQTSYIEDEAPESVVVKNKDALIKNLEKGIDDI